MLLLHFRNKFLGKEMFEPFFPNILEAFAMGWINIPGTSPEKGFLRVEFHHFDF